MKPWERNYTEQSVKPWEKDYSQPESTGKPWEQDYSAAPAGSPGEDKGTWDKAKDSGYVPFTGEVKEYDEETKAKARELLKKQGYDADSWSDAIITPIMSMANSISGAQAAKLAAPMYGVSEDVYRAALALRKESQPKSSLAGSIAGYIPGGIASGVARALGVAYEEAPDDDKAGSIVRTLGEEAIGLGVGRVIGEAIGAVKSAKNNRAIKNTLLDEGLTETQADEFIAKIQDTRQHYDDSIKVVKDLDDEQLKEFETLILKGDSVDNYKYKDMDKALDVYKDMVSKRQVLLEELVVPTEQLRAIDNQIAETAGLYKVQPNPSIARKLQRLEDKRKTVEETAANAEKKVAKLGMKMMDAQYVGAMADRRYGTSLMKEMNNVSRGMNKGLWVAKELEQDAQKVFNDLNIYTEADFKNATKMIENGNAPKELTDMIERLRTRVNSEYGEQVIAKRADYTPHYTKKAPQVLAILRNRVKEITGKPAGDTTLEDLAVIKKDQDLMDSLKYVSGFTGKKAGALADDSLINIVTSLKYGKPIRQMFDVNAASVKERIAEYVPKLIREDDLGLNLGNWIRSTTADASMREPLRKIKADADALKRVDPTMSDYLRNYVSDVAGGARGLAGMSRDKINDFSARQFEKAIVAQKLGKENIAYFHEAMAEAPQILQYMQMQLYPYFLGMRVDAVVRNLTQPYMLTIPEVGGSPVYMAKHALKGLINTVRGMTPGEFVNKESMKVLKAKGWLPPDPTPGQFQALRKGIRRGGNFKRGSKFAGEKLDNFAMWGYQKSDLANRVVTLEIGNSLAKDMIAGNKNAIQYLRRMPNAYRNKAIEALKAGDEEAVKDTVLDHLMATTQFNYNRASLSEYGREMGSAFSMFSKWPTAIGADIYDGFDAATFEGLKKSTALQKGTSKVLKKYLSPMLMLAAAQHALTDGEEISPRGKQVVGANPTSASPLTSVLGPLSDPGQAFTPPFFQAVKEAFTGDGLDTFLGLMPQAVYFKFLTERAPAWVNDERGQKPTEFLKEQAGLE